MAFKRNPANYRKQLERDGFILLKDILSGRLMNHLKAFHASTRAGAVQECGNWRIGGKKQQYLYDFPSDEVANNFRKGIAALTGMDENSITISERHLKQYDQRAPDYPAPHKDRGASRYSIGIPVYLGPETSVCVFPDLDRAPNMTDKAVFLTEAGHPGLAGIYASSEALMLNEELGDVIVFLGSSIFHERVKPRGTAVLYIKVNDEGHDPLGENIFAKKELVPA